MADIAVRAGQRFVLEPNRRIYYPRVRSDESSPSVIDIPHYRNNFLMLPFRVDHASRPKKALLLRLCLQVHRFHADIKSWR
jgi:hypothetical protein